MHGYQEGGYRVEDDGDDDGDDIEEDDDDGNEHGERRRQRRALSVGVAGAVQKASASPPAQHCSSVHGEPEVRSPLMSTDCAGLAPEVRSPLMSIAHRSMASPRCDLP